MGVLNGNAGFFSFLNDFDRIDWVGSYSVPKRQSTYYLVSVLGTPVMMEFHNSGEATVYFDKRSVTEGELSVSAEMVSMLSQEDVPEVLRSMEVLSGLVDYIGIVDDDLNIASAFDRSSGTLYDIEFNGCIQQLKTVSIYQLGVFDETVSESDTLLAILHAGESDSWFIYETCAVYVLHVDKSGFTSIQNYCYPIHNPTFVVDEIIETAGSIIDVAYTNDASIEAHIVSSTI